MVKFKKPALAMANTRADSEGGTLKKNGSKKRTPLCDIQQENFAFVTAHDCLTSPIEGRDSEVSQLQHIIQMQDKLITRLQKEVDMAADKLGKIKVLSPCIQVSKFI